MAEVDIRVWSILGSGPRIRRYRTMRFGTLGVRRHFSASCHSSEPLESTRRSGGVKLNHADETPIAPGPVDKNSLSASRASISPHRFRETGKMASDIKQRSYWPMASCARLHMSFRSCTMQHGSWFVARKRLRTQHMICASAAQIGRLRQRSDKYIHIYRVDAVASHAVRSTL